MNFTPFFIMYLFKNTYDYFILKSIKHIKIFYILCEILWIILFYNRANIVAFSLLDAILLQIVFLFIVLVTLTKDKNDPTRKMYEAIHQSPFIVKGFKGINFINKQESEMIYQSLKDTLFLEETFKGRNYLYISYEDLTLKYRFVYHNKKEYEKFQDMHEWMKVKSTNYQEKNNKIMCTYEETYRITKT